MPVISLRKRGPLKNDLHNTLPTLALIHHYDSMLKLLDPDRKASDKAKKRPKILLSNSEPPANLGTTERLTSAK